MSASTVELAAELRQADVQQIADSGSLGPLREVARYYAQVRVGLDDDVVGHHDTKTKIILATACCGNAYLVSASGRAKSRLIKSLAKHLGITCAVISLTSEHQPSDLTGWNILDQRRNEYRFIPGPLTSAGIRLVDEFNRATAFTQAGCLQALEDGFVTIDGDKKYVPDPNILMASANPADYGINPVATSMLDRFLLYALVGDLTDPNDQAELVLNARYDTKVQTLDREQDLEPDKLDEARRQAQRIRQYRNAIRDQVRLEESVVRYILDLVGGLRHHTSIAPGAARAGEPRDGGGGDRALLHLVWAAKAHAVLCSANGFVSPDDVQAVFTPVMAHRLFLDKVGQMANIAFSYGTAVADEVLATTPFDGGLRFRGR